MPSILSAPDKDDNYQGYMLFLLCWTWIAVNAVVCPIIILLFPATTFRTTFAFSVILAAAGFSLWLNLKRHTRAASFLFPLSLWLTITALVVAGGGVSAPVTLYYIPIILITGFLLGARWGVGMVTLCLLTMGSLVLLETKGILNPPPYIVNSLGRFIVYLGPFCMVLAIQYFAVNYIRRSLLRIDTAIDERKHVEELKHRIEHEHAERLKELTTLYNSCKVFQSEEKTLPDTMQVFVNNLPLGWQHSQNAAARVSIGNNTFATDNFAITPWLQKAEILTTNNQPCTIEVVYLTEEAQQDEGPFLKEERSLINMLADMLKIYLDRRESKESLSKSEANLQAIFTTTEVAYALTDENMNVISFNQAALLFSQKELGRAPTIGDELSSFFIPEQKDDFDKIIADAKQGKQVKHEAAYVQGIGSCNYYHVLLSPISISNHNHLGFLLAITDTTTIKQAENEIKTLNDSLEKKVEERTRELLETNMELEAFSYTVSHDLQAPLRAITGYGNILLQRKITLLDDEVKEFLLTINSKAKQMNELITNLLEYSKYGNAQLNKREVNMQELVQITLHEVQMGHYNPATKISVSNLPSAYCDNVLMRQVWGNLISNAAKYSSKRDLPLIEIGAEVSNDTTVYYVKDNGAGFDMKHANNLFGVFKRLHSQQEFEGTGVGLATVERIVSRHGGKIWCDAKPNEGATFYFTLSS